MKWLLALFLLSSFSVLASSFEGSLGLLQEGLFEREPNTFEGFTSPNSHTLAYGNILAKQEPFSSLTFQERLVARSSHSYLYQTQYYSQSLDVPQRLVAREAQDLTWNSEKKSSRQEVTLSEFFFKWDHSLFRLEAGRLVINYGQGEFFNPINPFNMANGTLLIQDVPQSVDGVVGTYFLTDKANLRLSVFEDKFETPSQKVRYSPWAILEWPMENSFSFLLAGGRDEDQTKIGGTFSFDFYDYQLFFQHMSFSGKEKAETLVGVDRQFNELWHFRSEFFYQKNGDRNSLVPQNYTLSAAVTYQWHPLFKIHPILLIDLENAFSYFILKGTWSFYKNADLTLFGQGPINSPEEQNVYQKLMLHQAGLMIQYYF